MKLSVVLLLGCVYATSIDAQAVLGFGTITGTIHDYTGSGIPDTTVIISNPGLALRRQLETTDDGLFHATALTPAPGYNLRVTRKGFQDQEYRNFELLPGHTLNFEVSLVQQPPSGRKEEVARLSVEDRTDFVAVETTFSQGVLSALPSKDQDPDSLVPLTVLDSPNYLTGQQVFRAYPATNAIETDGILTTTTYFYDGPPITPPVTQEPVEGMQVVSAMQPAEFGHTMGGTVNLATRTAGNQLHGQVYDYYNTHSFNAPDRFAGGFLPPGWQQQFGANAGGATGFHRTFWYLNVEDLDRHSEELNRVTNPLLANSLGTAILPANCTATAAQCAAAINFLNPQLNKVVESSIAALRGLGKIDWRPNDTHKISAEAGAVRQRSPNGTDINTVSNDGSLLGYNGTYTDDTLYGKAAYTGVLAADAVNEFRGTYYRDRFSDYEDPSLLPSTGTLGLDIAGSQFGANPQLPIALEEKRWQLIDNLTLAAGGHAFKLGVDLSFNQDWNRQIINSGGDYFYPTLTAFAEDFSGNTTSKKDYSTFIQGFGQPVVNLHSKWLNVYAQDTWSPTRRLTIVVGVLWEKPFLPKPTDTNTTFYQTGSISSPDIDFSPRVGLAYRLGDRTVVRVGVGSFYQPYTGSLLESLFTGNAIYQLTSVMTPQESAAPIYPKILGSPYAIPAGSTEVIYSNSKFRVPLAAEGTISIERRLGKDLTVSLNYLYDRGISLWTASDVNLNLPTVTKTYTIDNAAGTAVSTDPTLLYNVKTNTSFSQVFALGNDGKSEYSGAWIQIRKPLWRGVTLEGSYTWSHATNDMSGAAGVAGFIPMTTIPGGYRGDQGRASYEQPDRGVIVLTWQPVFSKGDSMMTRYFINGWSVSAGATLSSGIRETPTVLVNGQQFAGVTLEYPDTMNGSGGWNRVPFEGINSLSTGPEYNVDARLTRALPFSERVRGMLMFEAYNAFNMQFNTSVNTLAYLATSGILRPVAGVGLGNSAGGYPWGDNARHLQIALRVTF